MWKVEVLESCLYMFTSSQFCHQIRVIIHSHSDWSDCMPGLHILPLLRFLSGSMTFCNKASSARAGGLSLLSFWHYISQVPKMQERSNAEVGVRQKRQLELWAKVGWKQGRLLWAKTFTKLGKNLHKSIM